MTDLLAASPILAAREGRGLLAHLAGLVRR
jgi:hypothetical protein